MSALGTSHLLPAGGGGRLYSGGVGIFFCDVLGGEVEKKMTYSSGIGGGGGVRCVSLVFLFIKSHSFWGAPLPRPPIDQLYNVILSESLGRHWK